MRAVFMPKLFKILVPCLGLFLLLVQGAAQTVTPRQIKGRVVISGLPAPEGFSVLLAIVTNQNATPRANFPLARALTDADGRFSFDHLEELGGNAGKEVFALSAHFPAHKDGFALVDLRQLVSRDVTLELEPDSGDADSQGKDDAPAAAPAPPQTPPQPAEKPSGSQHAASRQLASLDAREAFARAQESLFKRHDPEAALKDLKLVIKSDPWFGPGYLLMGLAYMQLQNWSDAQWAFEEATKVEPANAEGYLGAGSALNEQKSYAAAQKVLEECLELRTDFAEAHYELGRSFWGLGKFEASAAHARRALEINGDYGGPHVLLGNIYLQQEDPQAALAEFQEYLRLEPEGGLAPAAKEMVGKLKKVLGGK
jgi:tetratricopeptide (TPR) repeat protein